jgi:hypothetical protein
VGVYFDVTVLAWHKYATVPKEIIEKKNALKHMLPDLKPCDFSEAELFISNRHIACALKGAVQEVRKLCRCTTEL